MNNEQQIRTILAPADPARGMTIPPAAATATQLIARAETAAARTSRPGLHRRRLVLAGGAAVAAAAMTAYVLPKRAATGDITNPQDNTPIGQALVPIAYEFDTNPQPAAAQLRTLAAQVTDTPYDAKTGRYAYRHAKYWDARTVERDGFAMGYVEEEQMWTAPDGSGRSRHKTLAAEFPNQESRRYWQREAAKLGLPPIHKRQWVQDIPADPAGSSPMQDADAVRPADRTRPPTTPADLAKLLRAEYGAADAAKWAMELYRSYIVPRHVRAQVLLTLADLDGFVWRGTATDRAGRTGVAVSLTYTPPPGNTDRNRYETILIFDPRTGALLAHEIAVLTPHHEPLLYALILDPNWTDTLG